VFRHVLLYFFLLSAFLFSVFQGGILCCHPPSPLLPLAWLAALFGFNFYMRVVVRSVENLGVPSVGCCRSPLLCLTAPFHSIPMQHAGSFPLVLFLESRAPPFSYSYVVDTHIHRISPVHSFLLGFGLGKVMNAGTHPHLCGACSYLTLLACFSCDLH
jgi:hypothetical protein